MGNVVLLGGAITWWSARGRAAAAASRGRRSGARERERVGPGALARGRRPAGERPAGRVICDAGACAARDGRERRRRVARIGQHAAASAPRPAARSTARAGRARRHVDRVGVDVVAGIAEARDDHGARVQRPLGHARRRPSRSARAGPGASVRAARGSRRARRSPRCGWARRLPSGVALRDERVGDLGRRPVAVRGPDHRRGGGHERRRERRAVRRDRPSRRSARRRASRRCTRMPVAPAPRDRPAGRASSSSRPAWTSPAPARRRRARRAARPGTCRSGAIRRRCRPRRRPARPRAAARAATRRAHASGRAVAETFTTCAPCRRSQPSASTSPCSSTVWLQAPGSDDARREQRRVRHEADDAARRAGWRPACWRPRCRARAGRAAAPARRPRGAGAAPDGARGDRRRRPSRRCRSCIPARRARAEVDRACASPDRPLGILAPTGAAALAGQRRRARRARRSARRARRAGAAAPARARARQPHEREAELAVEHA